ncbi:Ribonuclease/ribotoxin [Xylariaceae sp. FL0662B]|nr:Ribonuclease/ribotoxin [Xylariaceae sp. FL0662B]
MMFKSVLAIGILTGFANADYRCATNHGNFNIRSQWATAARDNGGNTPGRSGFPHEFGGGSGSGNTKLHFYGADSRCNQDNPSLFEFPVMKDGSTYARDQRHGVTGTPARVVYLQADLTLCGVMTHVIEDPQDHHGSGDFRVCDSV